MKYAKIIGTGSALPQKTLTNYDLEKIVETSNQWILERTGIKTRHILADNERVIDLAETAAKKAIAAAGINVTEIEQIIVACATSEYIFPNLACILQNRLGLKECSAFDINAACTGFIYELDIANKYITSGATSCVLVVAVEALSRVVNWEDRSTCVLFGDGAGAAVIKADKAPGIFSTHIHADGKYYDLLSAASGLYANEKPIIQMRGNEVFKIAVTKLAEVVEEALGYNNMTIDDLNWLIPHQANLRIIQATAKRIKLPEEKVIITIEDQGNTSAASVPLALDVAIRDGRIKTGDTVLMEAFGAGFTWGSALIKY